MAFKVEGVTKDKTGAVLGSCECFLLKYNSTTGLFTQVGSKVTSNASTGAYSFGGVADNDASYSVVAYKDSTPHVLDVTDRNLVPVVEPSGAGPVVFDASGQAAVNFATPLDVSITIGALCSFILVCLTARSHTLVSSAFWNPATDNQAFTRIDGVQTISGGGFDQPLEFWGLRSPITKGAGTVRLNLTNTSSVCAGIALSFTGTDPAKTVAQTVPTASIIKGASLSAIAGGGWSMATASDFITPAAGQLAVIASKSENTNSNTTSFTGTNATTRESHTGTRTRIVTSATAAATRNIITCDIADLCCGIGVILVP